MGVGQYELSDAQWSRIEGLLPVKGGIDLLRPYDSAVMEIYASNSKVGSVKNNGWSYWSMQKCHQSRNPGLPLNGP